MNLTASMLRESFVYKEGASSTHTVLMGGLDILQMTVWQDRT